MNTNGIQKVMLNISRLINKNSTTILTGLGVAGLITTTIMAVRATPKALLLINEEKLQRAGSYYEPDECYICESTHLPTFDSIKLTWKCYVPAAAMGAVTIACIIGANSIHTRRTAALASMYSLTDAAFKEYRTKVVQHIGEGRARTVKDEIAKDRITRNPVNDREVYVTGKGETLCYDMLSGRYFESDIEQIRRAINDLNESILTGVDIFITLNDVYYALELKSTKLGESVGWRVEDGQLRPHFSSQLTEKGRPCLVLDFDNEPVSMYAD